MTTNQNPTNRPRAARPAHVQPISLAGAADGLSVRLPAGADHLQIVDVYLDSRSVLPGSLYVGLPGTRTHGANFAAQAAALGAVALLTDAEGAELAADAGLPIVVAEQPRVAMAHMAARVFGDPTRDLLMIGITGTNGKTTCAFLIEGALIAAGHRVGTIGTIGFRLEGEPLPSSRSTITTPESCDLQALFAVMREGGADAIVMEVSSHALALDRVEGVHFDVAAFTNLGRDHLDFHKTQEAYFEAKAKLFRPTMTSRAVINGDDPWGRILVERADAAGAPHVVTTGFDPERDYRVLDSTPTIEGGEHIELATPGEAMAFDIALPGQYNVANAATTIAVLAQAGVNLDRAVPGLEKALVPGRMQRVDLGPDSPRVYVDFAHTPQAVESALSALPGRTLVVLGAGGDRDEAKRGPMGVAAARHADGVVVTDDNPRTEDPATIRAEVLAGARQVPDTEVIDGLDRRHAIGLALGMAHAGDAVAILGKGHETTQEINGVLHPFNDVTVVQQAWTSDHPDAAPADHEKPRTRGI
ncbi:MAG: UDP-N-acetylmuramoyl-L-alanyl-D-glutamate--2,6-diaminopimelate ligase [Propionibacterium freudenreichii]